MPAAFEHQTEQVPPVSIFGAISPHVPPTSDLLPRPRAEFLQGALIAVICEKAVPIPKQPAYNVPSCRRARTGVVKRIRL